MNVLNITQTEIERDWQWLFESVTSYMDKLAMMLVQNDVTVPCIPKRVAGRLVPYSFCGQIMLLLDYVREDRVISKTLVEENTKQFYQMMTLNVIDFVQDRTVDDDDDDDDDALAMAQQQREMQYAQMLDKIATLVPHPIAVIVLAANAKLKIAKNLWMSAAEMQAITGWDAEMAQRLGIEAQHCEERVVFKAEDIQKKIQKSDDLDE